MRVAAVSWDVGRAPNESAFEQYARNFLSQAKDLNVELIVFPEFFTLGVLASQTDFQVSRMEASVPYGLVEQMSAWSSEYEIAIVAGSTFTADGKNVAAAYWPDGRSALQSKNVLTQFESVEWGLSPGLGATLLPDPRFGINICYDCEFPQASKPLTDAGALCLIVPAYTETQHGFHRVRTCCQARAIERQIFVIHSSLVGTLGREPVPEAVGTSAILAPCVPPFPADGVLAETPTNQEGLAIAILDFDALLSCRNAGDVRNWHDRNLGNWDTTL